MRHAIAFVALASACAATRPTASTVTLPSLARAHDAVQRAASNDGQTGPLLVHDGIAYVADEDPPSVRAFDVRTLVELWAVPLDAAPAHLAIAGGRVYASLRSVDRIEAIDVKTRDVSVFARPCVEPIGLAAMGGAGGGIVVACGWSHELVGLSSAGDAIFRVDLAHEPRAVLVSNGRAFVSHASGSHLSIVTLQNRVVKTIALSAGVVSATASDDVPFARTAPGLQMVASNGFALAEHDGKIFAPAFVGTASRAQYVYQSYYGSPFEDGVVYELDEGYSDVFLAARLATRAGVRGCLAPRGVAVPSSTRTIVACPGEDTLVEQAPDGVVTRRIFAGASPSAVVVDPERNAVLVWSRHERTLSRVGLDDNASIAVGRATGQPRTSEALRHGRELFEATNDPRITRDGRGCVTCHPDGRTDDFTWETPEGPRQTSLLAGRLQGTAPYGWTRNSSSLSTYVTETMRRLQGRGLPPDDLTALVAYVETLRAPAASTVASSDATKGRAIFESKRAGCASCHAGPRLTDQQSHDLAEGAFDTPSLLFVGHTAPYFHDGRYDTLDELLTATDGQMGHTSHLSAADRRALEAYLLSL